MNTYSFPRYGSARITLHWLMALLMVAVYALIELREFYPKGSDPRELMKTLHFMLGLGVLFLAVLRIFVATQSPKPPITPALSAWQRILAAITHGLLYLLMLGLPLLGWLLLSAAGKPIPFFGIELPPQTAPPERGDQADVLVIAQGRGRDARALGDLADIQNSHA